MQIIRIKMTQTNITKKQTEILELLTKSEHALSASEIHARLPNMDLATVYRSVDKLTEMRKIQKLVLDGSKALYEHTEDVHHHALCDSCEEVIHFHVDEDKLRNVIDIPNFESAQIEIIVRGRHSEKKK